MNKFVDKTKINVNFEEPKVKEQVIKCACCEKDIVHCVILLDIKEDSTYKFKCPYCKGSSFVQNYEYKPLFEPISCKMSSITQLEGDNSWLINLTL